MTAKISYAAIFGFIFHWGRDETLILPPHSETACGGDNQSIFSQNEDQIIVIILIIIYIYARLSSYN